MEFAVWQTKGGGWTFNADGYRPNVWDFPIINGYTCQNTEEQRWHPTQKPEALMLQWVSIFSDEGDLVVDPYCGSGTTLVAAKRLGRRAIGCDIDPVNCANAARRLAATDVDERLVRAPIVRGKQAAMQFDLPPGGDGQAA
jgi:DNA modification methylase